MKDLKAGVALSLKDLYSQGIKKAGTETNNFSAGAVKAIDKVNSAMSGAMGKLGAIGVTVGFGVAVKSTIDMDDRLTRMGLSADATADQVNHLKQQIYAASQMPHIKLDPNEIISALEVVMTKTGDLKYVQDNIENIAVAIKATGEQGAAIGSVFSEFQKFKYSAEDISGLMDDMVKQGDQGAFTFGEFAKAGSAVISAYSNIGTSTKDIKNANAAMQIIMMGTKSAEIAVTALNSTMSELSDPKKQTDLRKMGIKVRDDVTGEFRDLNLIMQDMVKLVNEVGNADFLGSIFGSTSMQAIRAYVNFGDLYDNLTDLGDTTGAMFEKSATMAGTMKSNLQGLQTAFFSFADKNLTGPLEKLTELLNNLSENPEKVEKYIRNITIALGTLAAVKIGASLISFVATLKGFKGGGKIDIAGAAGGNGMPVYVTNWGGSAGASPMPNLGGGGIPGIGKTPAGKPAGTPLGGPKINPATLGKAGAAGAAMAAVVAIPQMIGELNEIDQNEDLTKKERNKAKGGAIGGAVGSIGGTAAGAIAGAAIGSVVPVVGTAIGALVGGAIGYFGGKLGRMAGEAIGEAITKEDIPATLSDEMQSMQELPQGQETAVLEGNAQIENHVYIHDDRIDVQSRVVNNSMPVQFPTGSYREYRGLTP